MPERLGENGSGEMAGGQQEPTGRGRVIARTADSENPGRWPAILPAGWRWANEEE